MNGRRLAACLVAVGALTAEVRAHDFHASFAILERSADGSIVEVSLRVFADDLEGALSARTGRPVTIGLTPDVDALISAYVAETLELRSSESVALALTWVGKEARVDSVWIYLETPAVSLDGLRLRNRVLHERFADQVNLVQLREGRRQAMLNFRKGDDLKGVTLSSP